ALFYSATGSARPVVWPLRERPKLGPRRSADDPPVSPPVRIGKLFAVAEAAGAVAFSNLYGITRGRGTGYRGLLLEGLNPWPNGSHVLIDTTPAGAFAHMLEARTIVLDGGGTLFRLQPPPVAGPAFVAAVYGGELAERQAEWNGTHLALE